MSAATLHVKPLRGPQIQPHLADLAELRIRVFRDWPYLYDGDAGYETDYLRVYADSADALVVLALDGERVVGASTGLPLMHETAMFHAPLMACGMDPRTVFYCGESVLLPEYRGRGLGHAFFDARHAHAQALSGFSHTAFAAVDRQSNDPRRPPDHRDLHAFWRSRGYQPHPDMRLHLAWKEIGGGDIDHTLTFWLRDLEAA